MPESLAVFPNPTSGIFTIAAGAAGNYVLYNSVGQKVTEVRLNSENNFSVTIDGLEAGIYLLMNTQGQEEIKRIVVTAR
jgi:hypothetical protein